MKKFDDKTSRAILAQLRENSRISWQRLGEAVHLSPQACAERVRQMQDAGIIGGFTLRENRPRHFITMLMAHNRFAEFERFLHSESGIESADKTSGEGCYHIVYLADTAAELDAFLTRLSAHGRYRTAGSLRRVVG